MTTAHSPAALAASRRPEPFRIGDRIIHATSLAEATAIATLRAATEAKHAAKLQAEAARKAAAVAARKAERETAAAATREATARKAAADRAFEREFAALLADEERATLASAARVYWLTGEGQRPDVSRAEPAPVAGTPRIQITARHRPGVGAPFVGDGSRTRPAHGVRAAHEYVPERTAAPVWAPRAATV